VWTEIRSSKIVKPHVVLLLGSTAIESVIGYRWKESVGTLSRWRGLAIPDVFANAWIISTFHPYFILRNSKDKGLQVIWAQDLMQAFRLLKVEIPVGSGVLPCTRILHGEQRLTFLQSLLDKAPDYLAFDFETTSIKPYSKEAKIVSVSFCYDGALGIAMKYDQEIKDLLCQVLHDKRTKKIAANIKFEDTWSRVKLGCRVRNFAWDTMIFSHLDDNRDDYNSLAFQVYINWGCNNFKEETDPYLKHSKNGINAIMDCPENALLTRNALDSCFEYRLFRKQKECLV
jgi:hypothetical protein